MTKREFKQWRRRLRAEARRRRLEEAKDPHRGSYNNTYMNQDTLWTHYDEEAINRAPKSGDFHTTTPYLFQKWERHGTNVCRFRWVNTTSRTSGFTAVGLLPEAASWWGGYSFTRSKRQSLIAAAQRAIVAKVMSEAPTWDILTDTVEAGQSVSMLTKSSSWFYELARLVRRRNGKAILQHMNILPTRKKVFKVENRLIVSHKYAVGKTGVDVFTSMSNIWMQYRYGVMPMIYSMRDAFNALTANPDLLKLQKRIQVTLKEHVFYQPSYKQVDNGSGLLYTLSKSYTVDGSIRHVAYVTFNDAVSVRLGLHSLSSLVNTLYEEVPLSWVLDWFIDIGSYLRGLAVTDITTSARVNTTEKGKSRITGGFSYSSKKGWSHVPVAYDMGGYSQHIYFSRTIGSLSSQLPTFDPWYNWKRALDTACLSWQRTKKYIHS